MSNQRQAVLQSIKIANGLRRPDTMCFSRAGESIFHLGGPGQWEGIFLMYVCIYIHMKPLI